MAVGNSQTCTDSETVLRKKKGDRGTSWYERTEDEGEERTLRRAFHVLVVHDDDRCRELAAMASNASANISYHCLGSEKEGESCGRDKRVTLR